MAVDLFKDGSTAYQIAAVCDATMLNGYSKAGFIKESMFIIELTYKVPLAEIDTHMQQHMAFLNKYYEAGNFIVSGRKIPREGGIIVAQATTKKAVEKIIKEDPFYKHKLADYNIIEFRASQQSSLLKDILE